MNTTNWVTLLLACLSMLISPTIFSAPSECVILLHGMGRSASSMSKIETHLLEADYRVWSQSYASTLAPVADLAESTINTALADCRTPGIEKVHFVSHSLGGILIRAYLQNRTIPQLHRIVMLAPPNHGSEITDMLKDNSVYTYAMGPAGQVLGTNKNSLPNQLKPIPGEIGIIAGNSSSDPWFSPFIPGDDDGKVSVESTRLKEMKAFIIVDAGHTFIMRNDRVIAELTHFLQHGIFRPKPKPKQG